MIISNDKAITNSNANSNTNNDNSNNNNDINDNILRADLYLS